MRKYVIFIVIYVVIALGAAGVWFYLNSQVSAENSRGDAVEKEANDARNKRDELVESISEKNSSSPTVSGRNTQRRSDVSSFRVSLEAAYANSGQSKTYPRCTAPVSIYLLSNPCFKNIGVTGNNLEDYLADFPTSDPSNENTRVCYYSNSNNEYILYIVPEPTNAPAACFSSVPSNAEDYSMS